MFYLYISNLFNVLLIKEIIGSNVSTNEKKYCMDSNHFLLDIYLMFDNKMLVKHTFDKTFFSCNNCNFNHLNPPQNIYFGGSCVEL